MTLNDANLLERRDLHMHVLYLFKTHFIFFTQERRKSVIFNSCTVCMKQKRSEKQKYTHLRMVTCELAIGCRNITHADVNLHQLPHKLRPFIKVFFAHKKKA